MKIYEFIKHGIQILEGYTKLLLRILHICKTDDTAAKRLDICNKCEHNTKGICSVCGCIIKAKVEVDFELDENGISIDGCPEYKW